MALRDWWRHGAGQALTRTLSWRLTIRLLAVTLGVMAPLIVTFAGYVGHRTYEDLVSKGRSLVLLGARVTGGALDDAIDSGALTLADVMRPRYEPIPGFEPPKFHTRYDVYLDNAILGVEDQFLRDEEVEYAVLVDRNGYVPTHNTRFDPPVTGDPAHDAANQTKRMLADPAGLRAARNRGAPLVQEIEARGVGAVEGLSLLDIAAPVTVKGRPWGAFRIGLRREVLGSRIRQAALLTAGMLASAAAIVALAVFLLIRAAVRPLSTLARMASRVAAGDLRVEAGPVAPRDEVGRLHNAFLTMTEALEAGRQRALQQDRLEQEMAVASQLQQSLLPRTLPSLAGLDVAVFLEAADEVGGDLYDCWELPDGRLLLCVGDVNGHGLPAAILMAMVKSAAFTQYSQVAALTARTAEDWTASLMQALNEMVHGASAQRRFVTLVAAVIDPAAPSCAFACAGHPPPCHYREGEGRVHAFEPLPAYPLGVKPRARYRVTEARLAAGDLLVFHTDGLTEALDPHGEPFGTERLEALVADHHHLGAEDLKEVVLAAWDAFRGEVAAEDDVTLLIVKVRGKEDGKREGGDEEGLRREEGRLPHTRRGPAPPEGLPVVPGGPQRPTSPQAPPSLLPLAPMHAASSHAMLGPPPP